MTDLIEHIDNQIKACIKEARMYGICHIVQGDNEQYPCTLEERSEYKAVPDNRFLVTIYHRLLNGNLDEREDLSFGKNPTRQTNQQIRTVVFIKMSEPLNRIDDIINAIPDIIEDDCYKSINVSKEVTLIRDAAAIWAAEFGDAYADKYQKEFNVYALEYNLEYIKCDVCV